jgi:hypothetical protein
MDEQKARFQALSAFTRTGFTTREAEVVMKNPRRRNVITWLIIIGNAGLITVIVTATSSLSSSSGSLLAIDLAILVAGVVFIYVIAKYTPLARIWGKFIEKRILKSEMFEDTSSQDLVHLPEGYGIIREFITRDSKLIGHSLLESFNPYDEFSVLGLERDKEWIALPKAREIIKENDVIIAYGELDSLRETFK